MDSIVLSIGSRVLPRCELSALLYLLILYCSLECDVLLLLCPVLIFLQTVTLCLIQQNQLSQQASEIPNDLNCHHIISKLLDSF